MRFAILRGTRTCHCENWYDCPSDFGCSSEYHTTIEEEDFRDPPIEVSEVKDVGEVITVIQQMRDLSLTGEVAHFDEAVKEFLGLVDQHKAEKILVQDWGEEIIIAVPVIEDNLPEWLTHPYQVVRQLVG